MKLNAMGESARVWVEKSARGAWWLGVESLPVRCGVEYGGVVGVKGIACKV